MTKTSEFAVIAEYAHGLDEGSTQIFAVIDDAVSTADTLNRQADGQAPVHYKVFALRELTESQMWDWGLRRADGRVSEYVSQQAARNSRYGDLVVVRRRAGGGEWATADQEAGVTNR
jgi:hypothetical protein